MFNLTSFTPRRTYSNNKKSYGLTIMDLRVIVYEYCTSNCISYPLNRETMPLEEIL